MARPLRIEYPGAVYHVTTRGNARQAIFKDDGDRKCFLDVLASVVEESNWLCHAYCLMENHYHLILETPEANLSRGMRQLNGVYTQRHNRRHGSGGHLFQGRFKAILVGRENYLLELCRYVVLNPVRAGLVKTAEEYAWSSYRATAGSASRPPYLSVDWVLGQFGERIGKAQARYRDFVRGGMPGESPWRRLRGQVFLGLDDLIEHLRPHLEKARRVKEIPRAQRFVGRPRLEELLAGLEGKARKVRNRLIRQAFERHGYLLSEIGRATGLHYSTIGRIVRTQSGT
jgi:REP element-mobilizing transposase RayT